MKLDRRTRGHRTTAQALRDLIHAELAHERAAQADTVRADELEAQVSQARERYQRLTGAEA